MDQSVHLVSENLFNMLRGALLMLFIWMCISLHPRRKESSILNYLFWILIILSAIQLVCFGGMCEQLRESKKYYNFVILLDLCLIPLIGSFLLKIMIPDWVNLGRAFLLLAPSVTLMLSYILTNNAMALFLSGIYTISIALLLFLFIFYISSRYGRYLKNNFSNIDNKTVDWVRTVSLVFAAWYGAWIIIAKINSRWLDSVYYLFLIGIWFFIYRFSIRHVSVVNAQELFDQQIVEPTESTPLITTECLATKIEAYMHTEQPWLNSSLTLQEFATSLKTNRTYLSEYLNKILDTNFYDYFNDFRITYACEKLLADPNLTLVEISEISGFNSLSTFRRAFEKRMGCTPTQYRKQQSDS